MCKKSAAKQCDEVLGHFALSDLCHVSLIKGSSFEDQIGKWFFFFKFQ